MATYWKIIVALVVLVCVIYLLTGFVMLVGLALRTLTKALERKSCEEAVSSRESESKKKRASEVLDTVICFSLAFFCFGNYFFTEATFLTNLLCVMFILSYFAFTPPWRYVRLTLSPLCAVALVADMLFKSLHSPFALALDATLLVFLVLRIFGVIRFSADFEQVLEK